MYVCMYIYIKFSNIQMYFLSNSSVNLRSVTVLHTFTH